MRRLIVIVVAVVAIGAAVLLGRARLRPQPPTSLLMNGQFTDVRGGMPAGWRPVTWVADNTTFEAVPAEDGGTALRMTNVRPNDARLCQAVSLDPTMTYRIAATVRTEDVGTALFGALVTVEPRVTDTRDLRGTQGWQRLEVVAAANGLRSWDVCLRLGSYGNLNTGTAYFRDVEVMPLFTRPTRWLPQIPSDASSLLRFVVASPATAAVLGMLLLAYGLGILGGRRQ